MHEYFVFITFNEISGDQMKFFIFQGLAVLTEYALRYYFQHLAIPNAVGFLFTLIFNGITSGYFLKPWIVCFQQNPKLKYSFIDFIVQSFFRK